MNRFLDIQMWTSESMNRKKIKEYKDELNDIMLYIARCTDGWLNSAWSIAENNNQD